MKLKHYKVSWRGPWDAKERGERILTMQSSSKLAAGRAHALLFPYKTRKIKVIR